MCLNVTILGRIECVSMLQHWGELTEVNVTTLGRIDCVSMLQHWGELTVSQCYNTGEN